MLVNPDDSPLAEPFSRRPREAEAPIPAEAGRAWRWRGTHLSRGSWPDSNWPWPPRPPGLQIRGAISEATGSGQRGKHRSEHGDDDVEGTVFVGQRFGIAFIELRRKILRCGAGARLFEKIGGDIQAL